MTLHLHDGTKIAMFLGCGPRSRFPGNERFVDATRALTRTIQRELTRHRDGAHSSSLLLERGGRPASAWLRDLPTLNAESYRRPSLPAEELWRIVENPSAPPTARAGAALVLRDNLDSAGCVRLRRAAEACAAPHLRAALDAVALAGPEDSTESLTLAFSLIEESSHARG
jgi:hypothetical protein